MGEEVNWLCRVIYGEDICEYGVATSMPLKDEGAAREAMRLCKAAGKKRSECLLLVSHRLRWATGTVNGDLAQQACRAIQDNEWQRACLEGLAEP